MDNVSECLFQRLAVTLVQAQNEHGQHGDDHEDRGGAGAKAAPEQKEKAPQSDVDRLMEGLNAESIRKLREYAELLLLGQEKEEKKP